MPLSPLTIIPIPSRYEIVFFLLLTAMFFLPGAALLTLSHTWKKWPGIQRYLAAVGLSLAFYPVLFYGLRSVWPQARLTAVPLAVILLISGVVTLWGEWRHQIFPIKLEKIEWAAVIILAITFISRFWVALAHPYPAWADSLHHTLLTQLTAVNGRLPHTLEPYFPNGLDMYHLGLYALSGSAQILGRVPAHTALLWTAQYLNSLVGIGVYLVLARYANRLGAVVGLAVVSLFSLHPALWVNWGRFTQLASLVLMPIVWTFTLELLRPAEPQPAESSRPRWGWVFLTALSTAALFFYHFRVAIFYLPLIGISFIWALVTTRNGRARRKLFMRMTAVGGIALILVIPALAAAAAQYLARSNRGSATLTPAQSQQLRQNYYEFPLTTIPYLVAPVWLLIVTSLAALLGFIRRRRLVWAMVIWAASLILIGNLYRLNIPQINFTNLGAVLIMLYLPIGLIIGTAVAEIPSFIPPHHRSKTVGGILCFILIAALPGGYKRATTIETHRHFLTNTDIEAMTWINQNLPPDATFVINTYFWLPKFAHGVDAGYWIPYFTHRHIVTSSMISGQTTAEYRQRTLALSEAGESLETDLSALETLYQSGVEYIFIGANGDFSGPGLQVEFLRQSDWVEPIFEDGGTFILQIRPPFRN